MSNLFKLDSTDALKGLLVAVLAAVFVWLAQVLNAPGFDFATFNWAELLKIVLAATSAYLAKNLLTDNDGKVLGVVKI